MKQKRNGDCLELVVPYQWAQKSLEELLINQWRVPRKTLHEWRMNKSVLVNGEALNWRHPLKLNDTLSIKMFTEEDHDIITEHDSINICYEDLHVLVVNKPAGIDTHPNVPKQTNTLANRVAGYFDDTGIHCRPHHIHRLDKDTSGGVLFAKHKLAGAMFDGLLAERKIKRTYTAVVEGIVKQQTGIINANIGKDRHHSTRRRVSSNGQHAVTHYRVVDTFPKSKISVVKCTLETGRTHQIRVHMSSIGHPLVGDTLYGSKRQTLEKQALHAHALSFYHPFLDKHIDVTVPLSKDIQVLLEKLAEKK
ncbi:RluA family pseudouridine synthase [Bacillus sp. HMF5848]|uniref:RluA family pseudouridine synthase n=1 Tax=Bacillus sp. HMF5848 TaxID=2495421 RepID=UPI000F7859B8|nr:RluA family pseudouridine synthase [Bacillus sp. HMF5848]RSK29252.1 RluA family pseudouridine synthase [Bacillus sp. HMF5848]